MKKNNFLKPPDKIKHIDTVILGAGLSGLSCAYHTGGSVFEKEKEIGGTCRTSRIKGYIFDYGIHVLHTKNKYVLGLLAKDKKLFLTQKKRSAWIYSRNILTKYPFQVNTFGLPRHIVEECIIGFRDAQKKPRNNPLNYREWIYATFGKGIADNFYIPYSEKFWTVKTKELTTDWLDVRVPRPSLSQVIAGARSIQKEEFGPNALFHYPRSQGIQRITEALLKPNTKIMLGKEAIKIEIDKKIIHFNNQTAVRYDKLISTIPLPELSKIINVIPVAVRQAIQGLRCNSVLCVNLGIRREDITSKHWIYFPEEKFAAFRISFPKNFSQLTVPKGWSSIQAEIAYSESRPVRYRDIAGKVIQDLIKARIISSRDQVKLINLHDIKYAYCLYDHGRLSNLDIINRFLHKNHIYTAGRYGKWEYLWMDEAILSGKNVLKEMAR
ncbi:MAG: hypothetical protein FJZ11_00100 [Candidatus Omnitrophica bacterium]|nr:hypothetical protein [Candidatus Omnitrophota bacterium]